jgi:hypothetical protein
VLLQEHSAELNESVRPRIVERPEDALSVVDCQGDHFRLKREGLLEEQPSRLIDERCQLADVLVGDAQAGEIHRGEVPSERGDS